MHDRIKRNCIIYEVPHQRLAVGRIEQPPLSTVSSREGRTPISRLKNKHGSLTTTALRRQRFVDVDLDLLGLGLGLLLELELQHAIFVLGGDVLSFDSRGKGEGAREATIAPLDAMEVLFLFFLLELALALYDQRVVFHGHVEVLFRDAGYFELQDDPLFIF